MFAKKTSLFALCLVGLLIASQGAYGADEKKKRGNRAAGTVKAVDAAAGTITVAVKNKKEVTETSYAVAKDAKITIDGASKSLADIQAGAMVRLALSEDGKSVTAINVGERKKKAAQ